MFVLNILGGNWYVFTITLPGVLFEWFPFESEFGLVPALVRV